MLKLDFCNILLLIEKKSEKAAEKVLNNIGMRFKGKPFFFNIFMYSYSDGHSINMANMCAKVRLTHNCCQFAVGVELPVFQLPVAWPVVVYIHTYVYIPGDS